MWKNTAILYLFQLFQSDGNSDKNREEKRSTFYCADRHIFESQISTRGPPSRSFLITLIINYIFSVHIHTKLPTLSYMITGTSPKLPVITVSIHLEIALSDQTFSNAWHSASKFH